VFIRYLLTEHDWCSHVIFVVGEPVAGKINRPLQLGGLRAKGIYEQYGYVSSNDIAPSANYRSDTL